MKVVTAHTMAKLESIAYQQGCSEVDFMEKAGHGVAEAVQNTIEEYALPKRVLLLCGKGNNAGDAFIAGIYLIDKGYQVYAIQPDSFDNCSAFVREAECGLKKKGDCFSIVLKTLHPLASF